MLKENFKLPQKSFLLTRSFYSLEEYYNNNSNYGLGFYLTTDISELFISVPY
jgi:hypothetical protein